MKTKYQEQRALFFSKKQQGIAILELIVVITLVTVLAISTYAIINGALKKDAMRTRISATKTVLFDGLNTYYINNYGDIKKNIGAYNNIPLTQLVQDGYISARLIYQDAHITNYRFGILAGPPIQLSLTIMTDQPARLLWLKPAKIEQGKAIFTQIPGYHHISGKLRLQNLGLIKFYDDENRPV